MNNRQKISLEQGKAFYEQSSKTARVKNRDETDECAECGDGGIDIKLNWDMARFDSLNNVWVVPIYESSLSEMTPFDEIGEVTTIEEAQRQINELLISKDKDGLFQLHIFKIAGAEKFRNLAKMSGNSWNRLDSVFEGLVGYFNLNDEVMQLYCINQGRLYAVTMFENELGSVQDRCEGGAWFIYSEFPCTGSPHHKCGEQCDCGTYTSLGHQINCTPPQCTWKMFCEDGSVVYSTSIGPTGSVYTPYPIPTGGSSSGPPKIKIPQIPNSILFGYGSQSENITKFKQNYGIDLMSSEYSSFAEECLEEVEEPGMNPGNTGQTPMTFTEFSNCVLQSLFYGLPYDQGDIDFVKQYPQTLNTILEMLGTQSFPPAPPIPGSPNPISPSNPICPEFFNWSFGSSNSGVTRNMNIGDFSINFLPLVGNTPYNLEIPNLYLEFYSSNSNATCQSNYSTWASSAINTAILEVNYDITNGFFSNPNSPDAGDDLRERVMRRFNAQYFQAAQHLTSTCGKDAQGAYIVTPMITEQPPLDAPSTLDFDFIMNQINCQ